MKMKLIKKIYDETELTKLIDYLEILRKKGVVSKSYEGCENLSDDLSDELDEAFYYECVEYVLDDIFSSILEPKFGTTRIEIEYRLGEFNLARVYLRNWENQR